MKLWIIFGLIVIVLVIFFFKSTLLHRIGYIVFLVWFFGIIGNYEINDKITLILENYLILNILYWLFFILLFLYCTIGLAESFFRIFSAEFTFEKYIREKYSLYKKKKTRRKDSGQFDVYSLFPQIQASGEYERIYNQCEDMEERAQFVEDWQRYLIDLQVHALSALIDNRTTESSKLYYSFDEWFKRHHLWKISEYHPAKSNQENLYNLPDTNLDVGLSEIVSQFSLKNSFWDGNLESKVYLVLRRIIHNDYIILPHIGLREVFYWKWDSDWRLTNKVTKMHFDFAIYTDDFLPVLFIEINGGEHRKQQTKLNDDFKHILVAQNKLKLITVDASSSIPDEKIEEVIREQIRNAVPDRRGHPAYCPNCHSRMNLRQNHQTKVYFYSCNKCNKTYNLSIVPPLYKDILSNIEESEI